MSVLGIDLGGTKAAIALFDRDGQMMSHESRHLNARRGQEVAGLINEQVLHYFGKAEQQGSPVESVGICVPGIYRSRTGTVWAPNIPGWDDFPLLESVRQITGNIPVRIDSDRAASICGEIWKGSARGCKDAIFMAVGTGIGAGILVNGQILRGSNDIAGAVGWMALDAPFRPAYIQAGCFESYASGTGIAASAKALMAEDENYDGELKNHNPDEIAAPLIFELCTRGDRIAKVVIDNCIQFWGMAIANLISIFNPQKVILGGGVFGPATRLIPSIVAETEKWAQPVSQKQVSIEASSLGSDAALYGAGYLAMQADIEVTINP